MATRPTTSLRRGRDRKIAGVCSGLAHAGGVDPWVVRAGFIILTTAGGIGIPLYIVLAIILPEAGAPPDAGLRWNVQLADARQPAGTAFVIGGTLLLLRNLGAPIPIGAVWGATAASGAMALGFFKATATNDDGTPRAQHLPSIVPGRDTMIRFLLGGVLVLAGLVTLFASGSGFTVLRQVLVGSVVTAGGLGLIVYPWMRGMLNDLRDERRERIRSEERADVAAHLHDSVLQTLALIQRNADRPRELVALARRQERELRTWLYSERTGGPAAGTLSASITAMAEEVESTHRIEVDVVSVGDCAVDAHVDALVNAAREAVVNAAKHAGVDSVSVYVEVEPRKASVFVRDRGKGFDRTAVPADRKGISDSIEQRMTRHGGAATVTTEPGGGTEVALEMPIDGQGGSS